MVREVFKFMVFRLLENALVSQKKSDSICIIVPKKGDILQQADIPQYSHSPAGSVLWGYGEGGCQLDDQRLKNELEICEWMGERHLNELWLL